MTPTYDQTANDQVTDSTQQHVDVTSRGYHAVAALVELATLSQDAPVRLAALTRSGAVSQSYLEQLFAGLRRHDIVKSTRGPGGGYSLSRPAKDISIAAIFMATAEDTVKKAEESPADLNSPAIRHLQAYLGRSLYDILSRRSLADVLRHSRHP
jgi:Rrf2 family iron-sulfur cluster assembly transcriptional regulator